MTNTPSKSELLPCPFCGCETVRQFHPFEQRGYVIDCNRCNGGFHNIPKDQAVGRWNTRAPSRPPADQVADVVQRVARALCEDNGDDPDDLDNSRICKADGTPLPLWAAYESAAIAALQAVPAASEVGWQPIETFDEPTSPGSGDGVLVADRNGTVGEAYFRNFGDRDDGWWWANTNWGDYPEPDRPDNPTHWRPLPEPPASGEE